MPDPSILAATRQIAAAVARHETAAAALENARAARARIVERVAALDAGRSEIIGRRQRGQIQPDDAGALALNAADREGLAAMMSDAAAVVDAARAPVEAAGNALTVARQGLQQAEDEVAEVALAAHAAVLDGLLLETVGRLADVHSRLLRPRPTWGPSRGLSEGLRRLQLQRGEI
jgi:hypothetical protein